MPVSGKHPAPRQDSSPADTPTLAEYREEYEEKYRTSIDYKRRSDFYEAYFKYPVKEKMIFYESFYGRGMTCNPAALFRYLLRDPRFADFTHVWVLERSEYQQTIKQQYRGCPNVIFVEPFTLDYAMYLASAKYLINNVTFQNYFVKKPEQVVINTWHGIPMKYLGYDVPNGSLNVANVIRNFLFTDYILSPVPYTTDNFRRGHKLDGLYSGKIIETGYPRVDETIHADRAQVASELALYGVEYDPNKKLILYAPTFRGAQYGKPDVDLEAHNRLMSVLHQCVDTEQYQILFKPHQIVYRFLQRRGIDLGNAVPAVVDTNRLLGVTDILISDYSSIFFDFLVTDRPILFYIPDLEEYHQNRGLYLTADELPGPVTDDLDQLGRWLGDMDHYDAFFDTEKYRSFQRRFVCNDDGDVCRRVVDAVFFGDERHAIRLNNDKIKLLFHTDLCLRNGVSSSAVNLMNHLDFDKYDVTFFGIGNRAFLPTYYATIDPRVRILTKSGMDVCTPEVRARVKHCMDEGLTVADGSETFPVDFFKLEYARAFGSSQFDYIINFSGFSGYWSNLYATQTGTRKLIWMHSVITKEYNRMLDGRYVFRKSLDGIFKLYKEYDACVSCSRTTNAINTRDMAALGFEGNFVHVRNLFNPDHVLSGAQQCVISREGGQDYFTDSDGKGHFSMVPMPEPGKPTFVYMGRVTNEKNHPVLVRAFAKLHARYPDARLYLIGDGPAAGDIRAYLRRTGLTGIVTMTGNLNNPFPIMSRCQCFILPSLYEGQPMVLLEARTLGLPIIVSKFDTVVDSLFENGQLVIGFDEESIYEGMKAFLEGKVPNDYHLDIERYNAEGLAEFEACLAAADAHWRERV